MINNSRVFSSSVVTAIPQLRAIQHPSQPPQKFVIVSQTNTQQAQQVQHIQQHTQQQQVNTIHQRPATPQSVLLTTQLNGSGGSVGSVTNSLLNISDRVSA